MHINVNVIFRKSIRDVLLSVSQTIIRSLEGTYLKGTIRDGPTKFRTLELADKSQLGKGGTQVMNEQHSAIL